MEDNENQPLVANIETKNNREDYENLDNNYEENPNYFDNSS